jgi:hypothetical protein
VTCEPPLVRATTLVEPSVLPFGWFLQSRDPHLSFFLTVLQRTKNSLSCPVDFVEGSRDGLKFGLV